MMGGASDPRLRAVSIAVILVAISGAISAVQPMVLRSVARPLVNESGLSPVSLAVNFLYSYGLALAVGVLFLYLSGRGGRLLRHRITDETRYWIRRSRCSDTSRCGGRHWSRQLPVRSHPFGERQSRADPIRRYCDHRNGSSTGRPLRRARRGVVLPERHPETARRRAAECSSRRFRGDVVRALTRANVLQSESGTDGQSVRKQPRRRARVRFDLRSNEEHRACGARACTLQHDRDRIGRGLSRLPTSFCAWVDRNERHGFVLIARAVGETVHTTVVPWDSRRNPQWDPIRVSRWTRQTSAIRRVPRDEPRPRRTPRAQWFACGPRPCRR